MMSRPCKALAIKIQECVGRNLTSTEQRMCEEMVMNFYINALLRYTDRFMRKGPILGSVTIDALYFSVMNGTLRGAGRRFEIVHLTGRLGEVYDRIMAYAGDEISQGALDDIIALASVASDKELEDAIGRARSACIHSVGYIKAIILNRKQKTQRMPPQEMRGVSPLAKVLHLAKDIESTKEKWDEEMRLSKAEQAAKKSIT